MAKSVDTIIIDTNVLLRHLLQDDSIQSAQAGQLIEAVEAGNIKLLLSTWVIAELIWVLRSVYKKQKSDIAKIIENIFATPGIVLSDKQLILEAFKWYSETNVDFDDAVIVLENKQKGAKKFFSFDKHFDKFSWLKKWQPDKDRHLLPN